MNSGSNANNSIKAFLKPEELAAFLSISKPTVYRLIERRQIPFYKVGGSLRFKKDDIFAYSENNRIEPIDMQIYECNEKERINGGSISGSTE